MTLLLLLVVEASRNSLIKGLKECDGMCIVAACLQGRKVEEVVVVVEVSRRRKHREKEKVVIRSDLMIYDSLLLG